MIKTQWQRRVNVTQFIYLCLSRNLNSNEIKTESLNYDFNAQQLKIIEYYCKNSLDIIKLISANLHKDWKWDRLSIMQQAIIIVAYCEYKSINLEKAIAIDQALVTADKFGQINEKPFINAILDKILK